MEENLIIEITPDDPIIDPKQSAPKTEKVEKIEKIAPEPVEDLRKQFEALQKTSAEKDAENARLRQEKQQSLAELSKSRVERIASDEAAIQNAIAAEKALLDSAKRDKKSALLENNIDAMADADERMAMAAGRLIRLEEGLSEVEQRKKEPPKVTQNAPNSFEEKISGAPPKIQAWLRQHPEYVENPAQNNRANAAHSMALAEGHEYGSDQYLEYCEKFLGLREEPKPKQNQSKPMAAAPVSRDGGVSSRGTVSSTQVTLTPGEQRAATDGSIVWNYTDPKLGAVKGEPVGLKEYARRKAALTQQGAYDKSYSEN